MTMLGTLHTDSKGFIIETSYTMQNEPTTLVSRYRVNVMNGQPQKETESVTFNGSWWSGYGFQCNTESMPESTDSVALKAPRGKKVYRDGEWRKY